MKLNKMIAVASAIILAIGSICIVRAEGSCDFTAESNVNGIDVILEDIAVLGEKNVKAAFSLENTGDKADVKVLMQLFDKNNLLVSGAEIIRSIKMGEAVDVEFNSTELIDTENMTLAVDVTETGEKYPTDIYVAQNGSDENNGTASSPLKTVSAALARVSSFNSNKEYEGKNITVQVADGNYNIAKPVNITEGTISNLGSLTIRGIGNNVRFYGGIKVKGSDFKKVTDISTLSMFDKSVEGKIYSLNLADYNVNVSYKDGTNINNDPIFTSICYNNRSEQIAKYPNEGYGVGTTRIGKDSENRKTQVKSADIKNWKNIEEAWIRGFFLYDWDLVRGKIASITDSVTGTDIDSTITGKTLTLQQMFCGSMPADNLRPITSQNKEWFVYNIPSELDTEGEYVIKNNVLYYYPTESDVVNSKFNNADIIINTSTSNLININSSNNVTISNVTFENTQGYFIDAKADNVSILGCKFTNGMTAVNIYGNYNTVLSCDFKNLGGSGIIIGGGDVNTLTASHSKLENCLFDKVSQIDRTNCSPVVLTGCGVTAAKNTITDTPHLALSYTGNNHIIEYNDIYNCLTDNSSDAGIIYTGNDLSNLGTVSRYNYIHDSNSGLGAIYYDDWLSGQSAVGNVFENISQVMLVHGGVYNTFRNNIVVNADIGTTVTHKDRFKTINGVKYNVWDEINGRYNGYNNVFLGKLVGIPESQGAEPGVDWKSAAWQTAYEDILAFVNNKNDNKASNTWIADNYFVNTDTAINPTREMKMSDLILSGNTTNAASLDAAHQTQYDKVVKNCGIYIDSYRKNK
ncbi:MAG: hypothetical protein J6N52_08770 [Clostridia bacterium]|nr:hypothetical protein [Clostridia bacterium]